MKIIKLQGGLGNQMFQYAHGRMLELSGKKVIFDISFFNGSKAKIDTARNFKLDNFNIETKAVFVSKKTPLLDILKKIQRKLGFKQECFFQNEKYFKNEEEQVRREFTLKNPPTDAAEKVLQQISTAKNSVSLHIRRGDYVNNKETNAYHGVCSPEYYNRAISVLKEKLGHLSLFVFSDDIEWVKNNLTFPFPTEYVSKHEIIDCEELILMSHCKHNIIANSTFSWWGAWLNKNPEKIVMAPKQWALKYQENFKDIIPETWIKL
ncbi:MAG: alpha-1,2-fucosyltransferase [Candidatus Paceibacterota bacterium]|jgi:hypothetical protein